MNTRFHTLKLLGWLLAAGLVSGQAQADDENTGSATASTQAVIVKPITLINASNLSFGRLASVAGTVSIDANSGMRSSNAPNLIAIKGGVANEPGRASFPVGGEPGLAYAISAPATSIVLSSSDGNELTVTLTGVYAENSKVTGGANAASTGTLNQLGADTLGIGGSLTLANNTPSGTYANASGIALTVNYN